jgi:biotin carboxylase
LVLLRGTESGSFANLVGVKVRRVLLLATTTGYQTRAFGDAAERLDIELMFATDRCHVLDDPWRDHAIAIRFDDERGSAAAILNEAARRPIDGVLAVGDRPTVIAALVQSALGLPGHAPEAAAIARNKLKTRQRLRDTGLPAPWFISTSADTAPGELAKTLSYPCVVKPLALSASRGVIRANDRDEFIAAFGRLAALLKSPDVGVERNPLHGVVLVEGFIAGREYALEGLLHHGALRTLAIFDKPDPLDGPFFEETIYVTPSRASERVQQAIKASVARAASAIGLAHGPIHAECRVNDSGVSVLEVAARPIGGLCAGAVRFGADGRQPLEEMLLRHAVGESPEQWTREPLASAVMMIPIPRRGIYRRTDGMDDACGVPGVDRVEITAKPDQLLIPLPEGASYLGFIFAHSSDPSAAEHAVRKAHARLRFVIDPELPVLTRV